jgi:cobalamin biosynthesis Co2+ chelatase CbiK
LLLNYQSIIEIIKLKRNGYQEKYKNNIYQIWEDEFLERVVEVAIFLSVYEFIVIGKSLIISDP